MNSTPTGSDDFWEDLLPDLYDVFSMREWYYNNLNGVCVHGEDGAGYWILDGKISDIPVNKPAPKGAAGVVWYNK